MERLRKGSENVETYTMGYKYRIYPNKEQENLINRTLGSCRFVFNIFSLYAATNGRQITSLSPIYRQPLCSRT